MTTKNPSCHTNAGSEQYNFAIKEFLTEWEEITLFESLDQKSTV